MESGLLLYLEKIKMVSTIDYREFKTYLTCPLLWSKIYLHHQSVNKFISYKDVCSSEDARLNFLLKP